VGFRDAVVAALPDDVAAGTPLALLLDDLPVANLISGYALLYSGNLGVGSADQGVKVDVCSGWRAAGTMMVSVRAGNGVPVTVGPPAPRIEDERAEDPLGWHDLQPLATGAMRRRRLIDVHVDGTWDVTAMFRDTHVVETGDETVLHEYSLMASVDPIRQTFLSCAAVPRVLPVECPVAAASALRLVGQHVSSVRDIVRAEFRGTSTCTHLNDRRATTTLWVSVGPSARASDSAVTIHCENGISLEMPSEPCRCMARCTTSYSTFGICALIAEMSLRTRL
jgi:hypothetical protein